MSNSPPEWSPAQESLLTTKAGSVKARASSAIRTKEAHADEYRRKILKISELRDGMKRVDVEAKIIDKSGTREVLSRYKDTVHRVATATITDGTGNIKLTLWNDQIEQVNVNDQVRVENGYVTSFRGEIQLNVGRYGKLSVT